MLHILQAATIIRVIFFRLHQYTESLCNQRGIMVGCASMNYYYRYSFFRLLLLLSLPSLLLLLVLLKMSMFFFAANYLNFLGRYQCYLKD